MDNDVFFVPNKFADPPVPIDPIPVTDPLPPIWNPLPPIKDYPPKDNGDGGGGPIKDPYLRAYLYSGVVRDAYTEQPLPGATVRINKGLSILAQQVADRNGNFQIQIGEYPADSITITEVSHKPYSWPASEAQHTFDLEPDVKDIDPVVLPPGTHKTNYLVWIIGGLVVAKWQKWI